MLNRPIVLTTALCVAGLWAPLSAQDETALSRIAFGSCAKADKPQPIWDVIAADEPELFLFIGDNIYADRHAVPQTAEDIQASYDELGAIPQWQSFVSTVPMLAVWDDHDYGKNDAGEEWGLKEESQRIFCDFFDVAEDSPRRTRDGIYDAQVFGPVGKRVQVILLDTRFNRSGLNHVDGWKQKGRRGPYDPADSGTMLGEPQWEWLEAQLRVPAEVRILASSIQVVAAEHEWEGWYTMPHERQRLYDLIDKTDASGVVMISGDRHLTELSCERGENTPYPMWDLTSSGMTDGPGQTDEPNRFRVGPVVRDTNYGMIEIDWETPDPVITLETRNKAGGVILSQRVWLSTLNGD